MAEGERTPLMTQQGGSFDKDLIRELAALLDETGLTEIEIEHEGRRVRVARGGGKTVYAADVTERRRARPRALPRGPTTSSSIPAR